LRDHQQRNVATAFSRARTSPFLDTWLARAVSEKVSERSAAEVFGE
jgi:hypothetical protein